MSIALDLYLFFRNSKTKLGLSLNARFVLSTLAFRIGSNTSTWIGQDALADEIGITRQNISGHLNKILKTKMLDVKLNKKDKRRNSYTICDKIKNYHQLTDQQKINVHKYFKDDYIGNIKKEKDMSRNQDISNNDMSRNQDINMSRNRDITFDEKSQETPATQAFSDNEKSPKAPSYNTSYKQSNRATGKKKKGSVSLTYYPNDFFPDDKRRELLSFHAKRTNNTEYYLLEQFEKVCKQYKTRAKDWQQTFIKFLEEEQPKRTYEDEKGQKRRYDNQSINY